MLYARINVETNEVLEYPINEVKLRDRLVNTSLPRVITDFSLAGTQYVCIPPVPFDTITLRPTETHQLETTSAYYDDETDTWTRVYELVEVRPIKRAIRTEFRWKELSKKRAAALSKLDAKIMRNLSETRQGLDTTENIEDLDTKAQELRDMTNLNAWDIDERTFFDV
jgi:hypothetical protein